MYTNLKLLMWRSRIHQNRMAQEVRMDEAVLSRIINGFRKPTPAQRRIIASYLNTDEDWLFARDEELERAPKFDKTNRPARSKGALES